MVETLGPTPEEMGVKELGEAKLTPEQKAQFRELLSGHYWSQKEKSEIEPVARDPREETYDLKRSHIDHKRAGEYTFNPETVGIDWKTIDPSQLELIKVPPEHGRRALEYLRGNLNEDYLLPGIEFAAALRNGEITLPKISDPDSEIENVYLPGTLARRADYGQWGILSIYKDDPKAILGCIPITLPLSSLTRRKRAKGERAEVNERFLVLRKNPEHSTNES